MATPQLLQAPRYDFATAPTLDWIADLTIKDAAGTAIDITGYTFAAQLAATPGADALADFTTEIITPASGLMRLSLPGADIADLDAGDYFYDVLMTNTSGETSLLLQGRLTIRATVTTPA